MASLTQRSSPITYVAEQPTSPQRAGQGTAYAEALAQRFDRDAAARPVLKQARDRQSVAMETLEGPGRHVTLLKWDEYARLVHAQCVRLESNLAIG